ncbi:MAG: hypothetical protein SWH61_03250 [Thermodesulfobacteriota bacterium]|nr:hypothetical protein [Thermodesulfobacteriota bacterium]
MANPSTSLTVQFITTVQDEDGNAIDPETASLSVELDDVRNNDKSQFLFGETAWFRVFRHPSNMAITITPSDGEILNGGVDTCEKTEQVTFAGVSQVDLSAAIKSLDGVSWLGNDLGSLTLVKPSTLQLAGSHDCENNPANCVGVAQVEFTAEFLSRGLSGISRPGGVTSYPVIVHILGIVEAD